MRYFYDTEFLEDGRTIELISIGIVAEDGREYYAVNRDAPWKRINNDGWLRANVLTSLPRYHGDARLHYRSRRNPMALDFGSPLMKHHAVIAAEVRDFLLGGSTFPELWADFGAYDHVVLCQLWGSMVDLPTGLPMFTRDVQQEAARLGVAGSDLPQQRAGHHNALADAQHVRVRWDFLRDRASAAAPEVAAAFHEAYERLAPAHGYATREASAKPWDDVPEQNRALMVATVADLLDRGVLTAPRRIEGSGL